MQILTNSNIELKTPLQEPFHYSIFPIVMFAIIIVLLIIVLIIISKKKETKNIPVVIEPNAKDKNQIKIAYLNELNELLKKVQENTITNRVAFQKLSKIIRNFIYEMTSIQVQNYTLADIEKINMPVLYKLVSEYYDPEFSKESKGNIINSIEKTRKVIEAWN